MQRVLFCTVSAVMLTFAANAAADSPRLKGSFAFTGTQVCLVAPGSVGPNLGNPTPGTALPNSGFFTDCGPGPGCHDLQPIDGHVFSFSNNVEGIETFNGDGTGTVKGTHLGTSVPPTPGPFLLAGYPSFPPSAGTSVFSFNFTYTVDDAGGFTSTMVPGSYVGRNVRGPRTGQTFTLDKLAPGTGLISQDGKTLITADVDPAGLNVTVETESHSNGDVWPQICHRSRVHVRLKSKDDDN